MKLYLLTRTDRVDYDEYDGYVIAATTENEARLIAAENHADEGGIVWKEPKTCEVRCIANDTPEELGIVLESFNAG